MSQAFLQIRSADESEARETEQGFQYPLEDNDGNVTYVSALTPDQIVECLKTLDPDDLNDIVNVLVKE